MSDQNCLLPELLDLIGDYLTIIEKQLMKYTCKMMYNIIKIKFSNFEPVLIKRINQQTKSNIGQKLINLIKQSNGLIQIGGSTITQCLYNDSLDDSDIDIYGLYDENKFNTIKSNTDQLNTRETISAFSSFDHIKYLMDLFNETSLLPEQYTSLYGPIENYMINGYHINYYDKEVIENDECTEDHKVKLQLVLVPENDHIDDKYDFTFCRNHYDGKNIMSYRKRDVLLKEGKMNKWSVLLDKANYKRGATPARVTEHMLLRMNKYLKRGYKILNSEKRLDQINEEIKKDILRNYYQENSKISNVVESKFNNWLLTRFDAMGGIIMSTRTLEVEFKKNGENEIKTLINNKGNPIIKGEEPPKKEPVKMLSKSYLQNLLNKGGSGENNSIDDENPVVTGSRFDVLNNDIKYVARFSN